jgi:hypothetical protein
MKHVHLAQSWRTKMTKTIRHSAEVLIGLSEGSTGHRQADLATFLFGVNRSCLRQDLFLASEVGVQIDLRRFY